MKRLTNQRGDTLVEVIFAIIILTSILVSTFTLGRQSRAQSDNASRRTAAINMMQEQYEALRSYRDRVGWPAFIGTYTVGFPGLSTGIARRHDAPSSCDPVDDCFHMERQSNNALADYGQWVPCPGQWFPPLDYDSTWNTPAGASTDPYYASFYSAYGCQGNARTHADQPIIQVGIIAADVTPPGLPTCSDLSIALSSNWPTTGTRVITINARTSQANSFIYSYITNVRNEPFGGTCG